jgi:maltose O-acetyltransferase
MIGPDVAIFTMSHKYGRTDIPMDAQGYSYSKVRIGNDVWIGYHAIILPGVSIGDGAIIGAGSIVTRDIPPYTVAAGVPARVVRDRKENASVIGPENAI